MQTGWRKQWSYQYVAPSHERGCSRTLEWHFHEKHGGLTFGGLSLLVLAIISFTLASVMTLLLNLNFCQNFINFNIVTLLFFTLTLLT